MIEDEAAELDAELREWARQALASAPRLLPVLPVADERRRRGWPVLLAAALVVGLVSLTAIAPRFLSTDRSKPATSTAKPDGLGYYDVTDGTFHLRRSATGGGPSDFAYKFGPVAPNIQPLSGDWDGDGRDGIGYFDPADGTVHLRDDATRPGPSDYAYILTTIPNAHVIVGDWTGDGRDGIGYWVPESKQDNTAMVYLRDDATKILSNQRSFTLPRLGNGSPELFAGDWTGTGQDGLADAEGSRQAGITQLYLDNQVGNGFQPKYQVALPAHGVPFAGDWTGDGKDGIGYFNPADGTVHLRNDATVAGPSDYVYQFSTAIRPDGPAMVLLAGHW